MPKTEPLTLSFIRETEAQIKAHHEKEKALTLKLVAEMVDTIYVGLPLTARGKLSDPEVAANAMLVNAATAFLKTVDLATAGYYPLAQNLVRLLAEHWIGALYVIKYPVKADLWLNLDQKTPSFATMAGAVFDDKDTEFLEKLRVLRETLNRFAHVTPVTWRKALGTSPEGNNEFRVGPSWNSAAFDSVLYPTLWIGSQLLQVLRLRGGTSDEEWMERAASVSRNVVLWMGTYNQAYGLKDAQE